MYYTTVESRKSKDKGVYMFTILIILSLLIVTPAYAAAPKQQQGGVPTLNANAKNKPAYDAKRSAAASNAAVNRGVRSTATTAVPMVESSNSPFRHTATPTPPSSSARYEATGSQSSGSSMPILTPRTTRETKGSGLSGGASASGLMLSGSQYAGGGSEVSNGGATGGSGTTQPGRPRRVGENDGDDEIPFPDPIGDAAWPLALLALAYLITRVTRKRGV